MRFIVVEDFSEGFFRRKEAGRVFHYDTAVKSGDAPAAHSMTRKSTSTPKKRVSFRGGKRFVTVRKVKAEMTGIAAVGNGPCMALGARPDSLRKKRLAPQKMPNGRVSRSRRAE